MLRQIVAAALLSGATLTISADPASALVFNYTLKAGDTLTADQSAAFQTAANAWSAVLSDNVTVNLVIGFSNTLGTNVLGATTPSLDQKTYLSAYSHLAADVTTANDVTAVASLPVTSSTTVLMTTAQEKALGYSVGNGSDGTIEFNSSFNFATSRNADGTIAGDSYDLIGIAEHEIGHSLGFVSNIDIGASAQNGASDRSILDLFRFGAPGANSYASGASAYFSIDGGNTYIAPFSNGVDDQASHWANNYQYNGVNALMDPEGALGQAINITALDAQALDVVGWNSVLATTTVPEPLTLALMLPAVLATIQVSRRRA